MSVEHPSPSQPADPWGDFWLRTLWRRSAESLGERARRRVSVHVIPVLFGLYILAYLDRSNISVAGLGMMRPPDEGGLGFSKSVIGNSGVFFWGYWLLEIPSTLCVLRWGARYVFCRILVLWGVCATLVGFVGMPWFGSLFSWLPHLPEDMAGLTSTAQFWNGLTDDPVNQFYFLRFMLGVFEGGFFPSVIVYLSLWYRPEDRAKAIASFMAAIPLSLAIGSPVSAALLNLHLFDLAPWRWIYIVEGIAPVLAGVGVLFCLPNRPGDAVWLPSEERNFLQAELDREQAKKVVHSHFQWIHHLGTVLSLTFVYFCLNVSGYGLSTFMPAIIRSKLGVSDQAASYLAALPYTCAFAAMLFNGRHSDRSGERIWHVAIPLACLTLAVILAASTYGYVTAPILVMLIICCVGTFMYSHLPAFWPIPTIFLGSSAAASAIGFINMIGNLGGYLGPRMVGSTASSSGQAVDFSKSLWWIAPWPVTAAAIILILGFARRRSFLDARSKSP